MAQKVAGWAGTRTGGAEDARVVARPRREGHIADHLHFLAGRVERLGHGARCGPEGFVVEKLTLAAELRVLAAEFSP